MPTPLDDDKVAAAAPMNRSYVNTICRGLGQDGLVIRRPEPADKLARASAGAGEHLARPDLPAVAQPPAR
ncbi:MAG: hypothetical protein ACR2MP_09325 [Streptosporangiaceae bacterium]